jgi:RNA polymerase sigma factor (sigma-70 family)
MTENEEFEKNFGLVVSQAIRFKDGAMCDRDDYIQAGSIGLIKALRGYDATQGSLSTFAYNAIRNEILQEVKKDKNKAHTINFEPSYSLISKITEFIPKLTDMQYEILLLRLENYTYAEIGDNYQKSKEWAREELFNIISIIRKANEEKNTVQE